MTGEAVGGCEPAQEQRLSFRLFALVATISGATWPAALLCAVKHFSYI